METIDRIIERYFEADLSEAEEADLKAFLASEAGQAPEYDEVRAVMGYFAVGRSVKVSSGEDSSGSLRSAPYPGKCSSEESSARGKFVRWSRVVAVAASLAMIVTLGVSLYNKDNVCVSIVEGRKVTDKEVVMNDVDNILSDLLADRVDMEEQLSNIFGE